VPTYQLPKNSHLRITSLMIISRKTWTRALEVREELKSLGWNSSSVAFYQLMNQVLKQKLVERKKQGGNSNGVPCKETYYKITRKGRKEIEAVLEFYSEMGMDYE